MDLPAAVRELRRAAGNNQQAFAGRLGLSPSAIANYEEGREPTSRALYQLGKVAREIGREDLALQFSSALSEKIGARVAIDIDESLEARIANELFRNNGDDWLQMELESLIARARKNPTVLRSPKVFSNVSRRLAHLEALLAFFRMKRMKSESAERIVEVLAGERSKETGETTDASKFWVLKTYPELAKRLNEEHRDVTSDMQYVSFPMIDMASFQREEQPQPIPSTPKKGTRKSRRKDQPEEEGGENR